MLRFILSGFIVTLSCFATLSAAENSTKASTSIKDPAALIGTEISRLDVLTQATRQSLDGQLKLREYIVEYQKIQEAYLKRPNSNDLLFSMIKSAHRVLQSIKENHLTHNFDPEFIEELTVLSQPAKKRGLPQP